MRFVQAHWAAEREGLKNSLSAAFTALGRTFRFVSIFHATILRSMTARGARVPSLQKWDRTSHGFVLPRPFAAITLSLCNVKQLY